MQRIVLDEMAINRCLASKGWSKLKFCRVAEMDIKTLRKAYTEGTSRVDTIGRIANTLEVQIDDILDKEKECHKFWKNETL